MSSNQCQRTGHEKEEIAFRHKRAELLSLPLSVTRLVGSMRPFKCTEIEQQQQQAAVMSSE
jgi:hypothetical protein